MKDIKPVKQNKISEQQSCKKIKVKKSSKIRDEQK